MKEYKKPPVKYHYKLADSAVDQRQWDGGRGKVMSVLRKAHWMTARDVANQLRIEPHVAQGLLQRLLAKGAVERRVIPGSVHDVPATPQRERAGLFFVGDKVIFDDGSDEEVMLIGEYSSEHDGFKMTYVNEGEQRSFYARELGVEGLYILVESGDAASTPKAETKPELNAEEKAKTPSMWRYIGQTQNPSRILAHRILEPAEQALAFNKKEYRKCFDAEPAKPEKFPFEVGTRFKYPATSDEYDVLGIDESTQEALVRHESGFTYPNTMPGHVRSAKLVGPSPMRFHVARPELLPNDALSEVSKVFGIGADKYERDDWAKENNGGGNHIEAALRHIDKHKKGQRLELGEAGSGLPHIYHAAARLLMAIGKEIRSKIQ